MEGDGVGVSVSRERWGVVAHPSRGQCSEAGVEAAVREVEEMGWLWEAVAEVASAA